MVTAIGLLPSVVSVNTITSAGAPSWTVRVSGVAGTASSSLRLVGPAAARVRVPAVEMEKTFNMGIGMAAILPAEAADAALALLQSRGVAAWVAGSVRPARPGEAGDADAKGGSGGVARVVGAHPEHR